MLTVDFGRLPVGPGCRVLDLGCGAGRHAFEAVRRGARVVALDTDRAELASVAAMVAAMREAGEVPDGADAVCAAGDALQITQVSNPLPAIATPAPVMPDPMVPVQTVGQGAHGLEFKPLVILLPSQPSAVYVGVTVAGTPRLPS